jgi:hypothetical protein
MSARQIPTTVSSGNPRNDTTAILLAFALILHRAV